MLNRRIWLAAALLSVSGILASSTMAQKPPPVPTVYVKNMHCEGCAKRLRTQLYKLPNVLKVVTNVKQGVAVITPSTGKDVSLKAIWEAAESEKFEVIKVANKSGTFNEKPKL